MHSEHTKYSCLQSNDWYTVASTDETLMFWQVIGAPDTSKRDKNKDEGGDFSKCHAYIL